MRVIIKEDYLQLCNWAAEYIVTVINEFQPAPDKKFVLGLPTGSSPIGVYNELIQLYNQKKVSFKNVVTFNMDEYVGLPAGHPQSYRFFMETHLFNHIDIPVENINFLNGNASDLEQECSNYELKIEEAGGINLFLGGVGSDGHLAFNEPGSSLKSKSRIKSLTLDTLAANSRFFDGKIENVPKKALTVGIDTVMQAQEVVLLVNGYNKARALKKIVDDGINHMWTASVLQLHKKGMIVCDEDATLELKVGTAKYFKDIEK